MLVGVDERRAERREDRYRKRACATTISSDAARRLPFLVRASKPRATARARAARRAARGKPPTSRRRARWTSGGGGGRSPFVVTFDTPARDENLSVDLDFFSVSFAFDASSSTWQFPRRGRREDGRGPTRVHERDDEDVREVQDDVREHAGELPARLELVHRVRAPGQRLGLGGTALAERSEGSK